MHIPIRCTLFLDLVTFLYFKYCQVPSVSSIAQKSPEYILLAWHGSSPMSRRKLPHKPPPPHGGPIKGLPKLLGGWGHAPEKPLAVLGQPPTTSRTPTGRGGHSTDTEHKENVLMKPHLPPAEYPSTICNLLSPPDKRERRFTEKDGESQPILISYCW